MTTPYTLKEAHTAPELSTITSTIWAANHTPYDTYAQLFFPVLGYTPSDRALALALAQTRLWTAHTATPSSHWFYVEDSTTRQVVGCAQWDMHTENPFPAGSGGGGMLRAPWWPDGEYREFCEEVMRQVYWPRGHWMRRPHMALNWMAVLPGYRRRGIGTLLMDVGTRRADELGIECWMEASAMGKPLYERHGFRSLFKMEFDMERKDASDVWRKCVHELTPSSFFPMWRPKGGVWEVEGVAVKLPWELGAA